VLFSFQFAPDPASGATYPRRAFVTSMLHVVGGVLPGFLAASLAPRIDADFAFSEAAATCRSRATAWPSALAVTAMFASAAGTGLISFIVLYAVDSGIDEGAAGRLLAGLSLAAATSRVVLGLALDRAGGDPLKPVSWMLLAGAGGLVLLIAGSPAAVMIGALVAGAVGWAWPGALTSAVVARAPGAPAWAVGVMMAGLFAGAVTGPLATGLLAGAEQFTAAWLVLAGSALAAAAMVAGVSRRSARPDRAGTR
jgi:hypothetical protein